MTIETEARNKDIKYLSIKIDFLKLRPVHATGVFNRDPSIAVQVRD